VTRAGPSPATAATRIGSASSVEAGSSGCSTNSFRLDGSAKPSSAQGSRISMTSPAATSSVRWSRTSSSTGKLASSWNSAGRFSPVVGTVCGRLRIWSGPTQAPLPGFMSSGSTSR
jgi:hypothetical protein